MEILDCALRTPSRTSYRTHAHARTYRHAHLQLALDEMQLLVGLSEHALELLAWGVRACVRVCVRA